MGIIKKKTLKEFWEKHGDSEIPLKTWYQNASKAIWENPNQIKKDYPSASILEGNRIVFNIKGNDYRLIVRINYHRKIIYIRFIDTHDKYDKIDATKV